MSSPSKPIYFLATGITSFIYLAFGVVLFGFIDVACDIENTANCGTPEHVSSIRTTRAVIALITLAAVFINIWLFLGMLILYVALGLLTRLGI
jgi:hypothetical protein